MGEGRFAFVGRDGGPACPPLARSWAARRTADGTGPVSVSPDGSVGSGGNGSVATGREAREACEGRRREARISQIS